VNPGTVLLVGLLVLVYLNFMARRRQQRERTALLERLVPGAQVVTTSGVHGTVTVLDEDGTVGVEVAPGVVTRWEKLAVGRIVSSPADAAEATDDPAGDETPAAVEAGATSIGAEPPVRAAEPVSPARPDTAPTDRA
jgi:preprotein translocase subunit YajC